MWTSDEVTIGRLRVQRGGNGDADPGRAASVTIGMLDLSPASLPRDAILCVRSMRDPAPGRLFLGSRNVRTAAVWQASVERKLAELASVAARPADGPVPAGAEAVLFRNEVELLACLAADWSEPGGRSRWWWHRLAGTSVDTSVGRAWQSAVPAIPAVVDRLAQRGELVKVLLGMEDREVLQLTRGLAMAFGVALSSPWEAWTAASSIPRPPVPRPRRRARTAGAGRSGEGTAVAIPRASPWAGLGADLAGLDRPRTLFAGLALTLSRAPNTARRAAFAIALEEWLRPSRAAATGESTRRRGGPPSTVSTAHNLSTSRREGEPANPLGRTQAPSSVLQIARPRTQRRVSIAAAASRRRRPQASARPALPVVPVAPIEDLPYPKTTEGIDTRLGGVFFLLDLALYLGLYGDFTRPAEPGIELDPWDYLTLLAGELGVGDELLHDPLGELLRRLAARPRGSRAGAGWDPGPDWQVPPAWLVPFTDTAGPWRWSAARGRLRVDHPAGFTVLDRRFAGAPTPARVRRALGARVNPPSLQRATLRPAKARGRRPADVWVARLGAYARARLRIALGASGSHDAPSDTATRLLRLAARVTTTPTAVDVTFDLAQLPIEVRAAGLDRDPGWIPAARRTVRFHFT